MYKTFGMKLTISILAAAVFMFCMGAGDLNAQRVDLPRKSPKAGVSYTVGLTQIDIRYGSPSVNDRQLWGSLVPYGEIWRAGANEATTITFSTDAIVEGEELSAGTYSFFVIPKRGTDSDWTVIFNKVADQWGAYKYDESRDALRVDVKPRFSDANVERLTYSIHDQGLDKGYIRLTWGDMRLYVRFLVDVLDQALTNVDEAIERAEENERWMIYAQGASFLLDNDLETRQAMEWADKSTSLYEHSWNWYIKARAQAKSGDYSGAISSASRSAEIGLANPDDTYYEDNRREIQGSVNQWKEKIGG